MKVAYSPCPNDTFVFHALTHGLVPGAPALDVTFADVDVTNTAALTGEYDLIKVSYAALPWLMDTYRLLPCGGALGRGCGPLIVTRPQTSDDHPAANLNGKTVAVPGERTTAYLLFRLWVANHAGTGEGAGTGGSPGVGPRIKVVPFHEIMPGVAAGKYDAGLVIHEARFTYPDHGLIALADLGEWWEAETSTPIPLGAILAHRTRVDAEKATEWVRASVRHAWAHPAESHDYVMAHAQEVSPEVAARHIGLYVNSFTEDLGEEGYRAVEAFLHRAAQAGLVPHCAIR